MEQLDDENLYNCGNCKRPTRAIKSIEIAKLPPFLIIHLKRFTANRKKIERPIRFPLKKLKLQVSTGDVLKFDLYGVINHYGSLDRGHYTAICKVKPRIDGVMIDKQNNNDKIESNGDQKWALFNDNSVT